MNYKKKYEEQQREFEKHEIAQYIKMDQSDKFEKVKTTELQKLEEDTEEARRLSEILSNKSAYCLNQWMDLGLCLYNINNEVLLDSWVIFCRNSVDYVEGECEKLWQSGQLRQKGNHMAKLNYFAESYNLLEYNEYKKSEAVAKINHTCENDVEKHVYTVSKMAFILYRYKYIHAETTGWYEFIGEKWIKRDQFPVTLKNRIKNEIRGLYIDFGVKRMIAKLEENDFLEDIYIELQILYNNKFFETELDQNRFLIGFDNGVYDLYKEEFRQACSADNISLTTCNDYIEFEEDDQLLSEINHFLCQLFPNEEIRNYVLSLLSSFLEGGNFHEKFHIWIAVDLECIKLLLRLFELAFGQYAKKSPNDFLTHKESRYELANTQAYRLRKIRFVSIEGEHKQQKLNASLIKEWSGGDLIICSKNGNDQYQPNFTYKPLFKMIYYTSIPPYLCPNDQAMTRRIAVLEFQSRSVNRPDPTNCYEFKKNPDIETQLQKWKQAFMFMLLKTYQSYKINGLIEPESIKQYNLEYNQYCREEY